MSRYMLPTTNYGILWAEDHLGYKSTLTPGLGYLTYYLTAAYSGLGRVKKNNNSLLSFESLLFTTNSDQLV